MQTWRWKQFPDCDSRHAANLTEQGTTQVKSEFYDFIAKKVAVDLHGPRGTQHASCAFGPFVALSQVPVCLDTEKVDRPTATGVEVFSHDSIGHFRPCSVFNPARVLRVAGYVCCIGTVPMHVFPATFPDCIRFRCYLLCCSLSFGRIFPRVVCVGTARLRASTARPREETLIGQANREESLMNAEATGC